MNEYLDAAETILAISGAVAIVYGPLQTALADYLRQRHFEKRDDLFDLAKSGAISFDDPIYKLCREKLNTSIQYAHVMTLMRIIWMSQSLNRHGIKAKSINFHDVRDVGTREKLESIMRSANLNTVIVSVARSPIILMIGLSIVLPKVIAKATRGWMANASTGIFSLMKNIFWQKAIYAVEESIDREMDAAMC
ncbi:hypothetical protein [Asaia spathodeae]|uniref:ABC transmembrane type-1 domain-containing protein n=1 Tax=Asaia spathodeae TaxID=657016 RepID=A0ABX2P5Y5_9PROT|nr:hypothetical protein [Asaia spathodeae]GBR10870.1 hypothetical protein AA105894_0002 [Asaia spathodeae NBRC 105894]